MRSWAPDSGVRRHGKGTVNGSSGKFSLEPMTEEVARQIAGWRYRGEHALYNTAPDAVEEEVKTLLNPHCAYYAVWHDECGLFGFCCYGQEAQVPGGDYGVEAVDIGLGIRPDLIGRGMGADFLQAVLTHIEESEGPALLRATIAAFNGSCRRIFEKAGFHQEQVFSVAEERDLEFVVAVKDPARSSPTKVTQ
jgi:[ribosomal protein S18]-alanine N-acetyltransferase